MKRNIKKQVLNLQKKKNSKNELGSTMNHMLCDIENNILQVMINYLEENKILKTSLVMIFYCFMIYKDDVKKQILMNY